MGGGLQRGGGRGAGRGGGGGGGRRAGGCCPCPASCLSSQSPSPRVWEPTVKQQCQKNLFDLHIFSRTELSALCYCEQSSQKDHLQKLVF